MNRSISSTALRVACDVTLACSVLFEMGPAQAQQARVFSFSDNPVVIRDPDERISGNAVVGATFIDGSARADVNAFYVYFSRPPTLPFEIQLATVDGRYLASYTGASWVQSTPSPQNGGPACLPPVGGPSGKWREPTADTCAGSPFCGWVQLKLELGDDDQPPTVELNELAALVRDSSDQTYVTSWGACREQNTVRLYVNSEDTQAYFLTKDDSTRDCAIASSRSGFKFDRVCDVSIEDIIDDKVYVMRKRGAGFSEPIEINVIAPEIL